MVGFPASHAKKNGETPPFNQPKENGKASKDLFRDRLRMDSSDGKCCETRKPTNLQY